MTIRAIAAVAWLLVSPAAFALTAYAQTAYAQTGSTPATTSYPAKAKTAKHATSHGPASATQKVPAGKTVAGKSATAKTGAAKPQGKHVPVLVPRHKPPARAAVAAAKKAVVRKEPPAPAAVPAAQAPKPAAPPAADVGTNTGLHLPRYASLKSDDVNMRVGPAERYPVIWTYKRRELPVKIEREFDIWRLVEDMDGVKGWVHQATLTGRRTFVITGTDDRTLRGDASETADAVAILKPGVVGRIKSCEAGRAWCQVQVGEYRGWLQRGDVWGVDADEVVAP